jgi:hypothetical protein
MSLFLKSNTHRKKHTQKCTNKKSRNLSSSKNLITLRDTDNGNSALGLATIIKKLLLYINNTIPLHTLEKTNYFCNTNAVMKQ